MYYYIIGIPKIPADNNNGYSTCTSRNQWLYVDEEYSDARAPEDWGVIEKYEHYNCFPPVHCAVSGRSPGAKDNKKQ